MSPPWIRLPVAVGTVLGWNRSAAFVFAAVGSDLLWGSSIARAWLWFAAAPRGGLLSRSWTAASHFEDVQNLGSGHAAPRFI